jgi:hypothetical protein
MYFTSDLKIFSNTSRFTQFLSPSSGVGPSLCSSSRSLFYEKKVMSLTPLDSDCLRKKEI